MSHALYFAGGIFIRKNALIKTSFLFLLYMALITACSMMLIFAGGGQLLGFHLGMLAGVDNWGEALETSLGMVRLAWFVLLPLGLYAAAYFRARENEVRE
jgi:hypothetical protein